MNMFLIRLITLSSLLCVLSCEAQPALAEGPNIYGAGATFCRDIKENFIIKFTWVQGYVSENNVLTWVQFHQKFDPLPPEFPAEEQAKLIGGYCIANPDKDVSDAADALIQKLKALDALRGTVQ